MHKSIMIGLGAALATFAVSVTEASASCRRTCRHYGPPPVYNYAPPPPAYGYAPRVRVYGHAPPPAYYGPPPAVGPTYYSPPAPVYGFYPPPPAYAPPAYFDAYRPAGVWIEIR